MKKLWSFFWLFVAWCVALTVLASWAMPYLWIVALVVFLAVTAFAGFKVWRYVRDARGHY